MTAIDPQTALLELLDPPLSGVGGAELRATHRSNAVQMLVLLATTALPAYAQARPGDWNGLQSYVDTLDSLADGFAQAEARRLPDDPIPTYAFTPSALDDSLAPPGHHTVYLACPTAPFRVRGGWDAAKEEFADRMIDTVEVRAPGFRSTIVGRAVRTPQDMADELRWPGAHPMSLDVSLDQLGWMRPTRALSGHDTPVAGLFITGAGHRARRGHRRLTRPRRGQSGPHLAPPRRPLTRGYRHLINAAAATPSPPASSDPELPVSKFAPG